MKAFLNKYSYSMVKMLLNQIVISVFGLMLSMAAMQVGKASNIPEGSINKFAVAMSIFSVIFYLFLIYTQTWEIGSKDRVSTDYGKLGYNPHRGLILSFGANTPNFLVAVLFTSFFPFLSTSEGVRTAGNIFQLIGTLMNGMYIGMITEFQAGGFNLNTWWWTYFLLPIPAMLTAWVAYCLGHKNKRFTSLFVYKPEKKK